MELKRKKSNFKPLILLVAIGVTLYGYAKFQEQDAHPGLPASEKYWQCILDKMPGTSTDTIAYQSANACQMEYGEAQTVPDRDKKGGLFSVPHAQECVLRYGKITQSEIAAQLIVAACNQLYFQ